MLHRPFPELDRVEIHPFVGAMHGKVAISDPASEVGLGHPEIARRLA
jgi:hypothetical protein